MRRLLLLLLILFLIIGIPLGVYFWARNTGKPVAIPLLDNALPESFGLNTSPGVNLSDFQQSETPLADPIIGESCYVENNFTCLFNNVSTASGMLQIRLENTARPDHRLSLGIFLGTLGPLQQQYQFGLGNGGADMLPFSNSVSTVLSEGNRNNISPMFLLAYYDFMMEQAKAQNVPPQDWGLPLSDAFPFSPSPADVAATFRVARQLFPDEGSAIAAGEILVQDDSLSSMLNNTSLTPAGKAMVYTTSQLFGSKVAVQIFTSPDAFALHYNELFRDPRFAGTFPVTQVAGQNSPFEYFYRPTPQREIVICRAAQTFSCPISFDDTTLSGEAELGVCAPTPFFDSFCAEGLLLEVE